MRRLRGRPAIALCLPGWRRWRMPSRWIWGARRWGRWRRSGRSRSFARSTACTGRCRSIRAGSAALAGDLLKEASDRALPLVAVGLMYRQGYFRQRLEVSGWQQEYWVDIDPERLPAALVRAPDGRPLTITVPIRGREVRAQIWRVAVGRVPLFLLDADVPENGRLERWITSQLYVADPITRLSQYALLGVGGVRALAALGIEPALVHLNEGHAAFAVLELARGEMARGASVEAALEAARQRTVFTTHTPVAAGNETYPREEVIGTVGGVAAELGVDPEVLLRLGRYHPEDGRRAVRDDDVQPADEPLGERRQPPPRRRRARDVARAVAGAGASRRCRSPMSPTACTCRAGSGLRCAACSTATSVRRGGGRRATSRPGRRLTRCPTPSCGRRGASSAQSWWSSSRNAAGSTGSPSTSRARGSRRPPARLTPTCSRSGSRGAPRPTSASGSSPTIPAARSRCSAGPQPVQFVLAGKAHPSDEEAKRVVQELFRFKDAPHVAERVVYLHDYDLGMAARLVRGCDLWLNLPRPPLEASGTSGMKAVINGGLNLSVLDGWWAEAYDGTNGWALSGEVDPDPAAQDARDAAALYDLLEQEVLPAFYDRDADGLPRSWLARIRASMRTLAPAFCAGRMLDDYLERIYAPTTTSA